jgi:3-phenylpropionate/trans-cinnamate dioxygenase ferredoxin subunit
MIGDLPMAEHLVARVSDLPPGTLQLVEVDGEPICLARVDDGTIYAIADACTHEQYPLSEGEVLGNEIECPQHSSRFDLRTGQPTARPAVMPARVFPVTVIGEEVYIRA